MRRFLSILFPTLDEEAAQLLETELGNLLLFARVIEGEGLMLAYPLSGCPEC